MSIVKLNNQGVKNATAFGSITGLGSMVFIKKLTASSSATLSFVDGASSVVLDNTYKEYLFTFNNIHPSGNSAHFNFNLSIDSGSNYNVSKTSTLFYASNGESGSNIGASISYWGVNSTEGDLANSSADQNLARNQNADNDSSISGTLQIFNPSSTSFVKHFISSSSSIYHEGSVNGEFNYYVAGYGNTTSAVDAIQFKMSSGNIDSGDICLYGIA
jgi:hypothetical protein